MSVQPKDYALVIGIEHYPAYKPLQGAVADAEEFAGWLTDKDTGGGLRTENCKKFLSADQKPPYPSWDSIDLAMDEIRVQAQESGARRFYLYFSGHGHAPENEEICLCLGRWAPSGSSRVALNSGEYYRFFINCIGFQQVIVFLDCCRVRVVSASGEGPGVNCVKPLPTAGGTKVFRALATEYQLPSYEAAVTQAGLDSPLVRGHFTRTLMTGLRGGAASPSGGVKPSALADYLKLWVPRIAKEHDHNQNVDIPQNTLPDDDPDSFFGSALPTTPANVTIRFKSARKGEIVLVGPSLEEIRRSLASTGPWSLTLSPGLYILEDMQNSEKMDIRFRGEEDMTDVEF